ncbi:MAG: 16S rRNA (guanine(527)-N(7))-methyltransferase RsmG [Kiritimatiellaceae bacterium]|nr:16S rRNA (guanine(527)-N(7))-methyltransferase RsmG [Kiritimatiellaceae bacterium]
MNKKVWLQFFSDSVVNAGFDLSEQQSGLFFLYMEELIEWNLTTNLTRIVEPRDVAIKHFLDSILITRYIDIAGKTIADAGSGAGFPGIPLAILDPSSRIVLMESVGKKCAFLKHAVRTLGLNNVEVYNGRAESWPEPGSFDLAVSRALASLAKCAAVCRPLIKRQGAIVCMKGRLPDDEIAGLQKEKNPGFVLDSHSYSLPEHAGERSIIILRPCFT